MGEKQRNIFHVKQANKLRQNHGYNYKVYINKITLNIYLLNIKTYTNYLQK